MEIRKINDIDDNTILECLNCGYMDIAKERERL